MGEHGQGVSQTGQEKFFPKVNSSTEQPHRRWNPLLREWVLVSPHRTKRPWQGQTEPVTEARPRHDPNCYLCPGNERAGGVRNEDYTDTFVFQNDFAALLDQGAGVDTSVDDPLFRSTSASGECRVLCFSPRHDLTLAQLPKAGVRRVVDLWAAQSAELGRRWKWAQVFENKGAAMGCSNPHPHGQIWAGDFLPNEVEREDRSQAAYLAAHGSPMLIDYARRESEDGERVVTENGNWIAVVPYWAVWPFETLLLPKHPVRQLEDLNAAARDDLAEALRDLLIRYDNLFQCSFPYSMGWHGAPNGETAVEHWTLHAHFYPPLLRSASVKKFMVGYELLAEAQRDLTAEQAADRLRKVDTVHYSERSL
ncbi:MAG: UDP-glucose--hexose-1-phosphate uridylyltransferase [Verrucomicrobiae bacterium]|nr:UDP-glucose--hexose-1-phosphate uridylyltransferase [Verrucomicrobiae bacterium]